GPGALRPGPRRGDGHELRLRPGGSGALPERGGRLRPVPCRGQVRPGGDRPGRVDEADRLRADKPARRVVKTSRWLLLRNRENVPDEQVVRLEELLAANKALLTVYLLKEDLEGLWRYRREAWAWKAWKSWKRRALRSGLEPLRVFVRRLEPYLSGILAHCRWPLGTNLVEGIN